MKKFLTMMAVAAIVAGCAKDVNENELYDVKDGKRVAFLLDGDFKNPSFTRSLTADGQEMTDVWVFDFVDDVCEQFVHKVQGDDDFETPSLTLANGSHRLCFVVSRGDTPVLDEQHTTITWSRPSDTFWAEYEMTVSSETPSTVSITLDRVATKLKLLITDQVPTNLAKLTVTPTIWYYGLDYFYGTPTTEKENQERSVNVPSSYVGTEGQLTFSIFGISGIDEWTTNLLLTATDGDDSEIGRATITAAPFISDRQTVYSGRLFSQEGGFTLTLNDTWIADYTGEW